MTTSRVIRGTRAKIFLYICGILVVTGVIACYNNTLSELEDAKKSSENCHQQGENLSTQLQVISEYKQRLENSLKAEKAEHQQTKNNMETKLNEEKSKHEKYQGELKLKHSSLQQHFNLLQTEYDDFKDEYSKTQQKQHEEVNKLEAKLREVQEELKKVRTSKESLKTQYLEVLSEKEKLEGQVKEEAADDVEKESNVNHLTKERNELRREVERLKLNCRPLDTLPEPKLVPEAQPSPKTLDQMSLISPFLYEIKPAPKIPENADNQRVLAKPNGNDNKPSSSTSTARSDLRSSQPNLGNVQPLLQPTVTPETLRRNVTLDKKKLPDGVVAAPERREIANEPQEVVDNRYRNVKDSANDQIIEKPAKEDMDKENGAHEEFDGPLGNNAFEGLGFDEHVKHAEKQNFDKQHIDKLGVNKEDQDYKDLQNDVQLEENEEDDDIDGYEDRLARQKDPAVRN